MLNVVEKELFFLICCKYYKKKKPKKSVFVWNVYTYGFISVEQEI